MEMTTFLSQLWGPVILAVGLGVFISRDYYVRLYRELEKETLAVLLFGMVGMTAGLVHVMVHNAWGSLPEVIVSIFGWGLLIKGTLFVLAPRLVDKVGDGWANLKLIPFAGGLMLVVGAYLTWVGYFA